MILKVIFIYETNRATVKPSARPMWRPAIAWLPSCPRRGQSGGTRYARVVR